MKIIVASHNPSKILEIQDLLSSLPIEVVGLNDLGLVDDIEETGSSFIENATLKAQAIAKVFPNDLIVADDSGICIHALDMQPGIFSARFLPEYVDYKDKNKKVLELLENSDNRKAYFICAIHIIFKRQSFDIQEVVYGNLSTQPIGEGGFGYDPIFIPEGYDQTFAQNPPLKARISHRAKALNKVVEYVEFLF